MNGLNLTSGLNKHIHIIPGAHGSLKLHSDVWIGSSVLHVGDLIRVNGSGIITAGNLEIDAEASSIRSVSGNMTFTPADSAIFAKQNGSSTMVLVGDQAQLVLKGGEESFALSTAAGQFQLQGTNHVSTAAEVLLSTDFVVLQDFLVARTAWVSTFADIVKAEHFSSNSSVVGDLSLSESKLWSHDPDNNLSIVSAAGVFIGSSAGGANIELQPEGTGQVIVDSSLILNGSRIFAAEPSGGLILGSAGSLRLSCTGNMSLLSAGAVDLGSTGRVQIHTTSDIDVQSTKFTLRADRNLNVSENELSLLVHSNVHMRSLHDMQLTATDSIAAHTDGNMSLTSRASDFSSANAITLQAAVLALRSGLCS
eukprot:COSAG05_NODE_4343_length_1557_cov_3.271135_1_plen_365_part_10